MLQILKKSQEKHIRPKGISAIHARVKELLLQHKDSNGSKTPGQVLDAAAGNGFMTEWLDLQGYAVTPLDIDTEQWAYPKVKSIGADLNKDIDLPDSSFDLIVSVETIEHLENPYHLIREFSRLLRPGGRIVITTPNVHSMKSRLKYTTLGLPSLFEYINDDAMGQHISPISMGTYFYAFDRSDLRLVDLCSVGEESSAINRAFKNIINSVTMMFLKRIRTRNGHPPEYYLRRLTDTQLKHLIDDTILIVVVEKQT